MTLTSHARPEDFVDTRFNRDLPPSTTPARTYGKDS